MQTVREYVDRFTPLPMFLATLAIFALMASILPALNESFDIHFSSRVQIAFWLIYPLFIIDCVLHLVIDSRSWRQRLLACFIPPLRLVGRDCQSGKSVWLPGLGWIERDDQLEGRMERALSGPMILVALLMIPLIGIEFFWPPTDDSVMGSILTGGTRFVWLAFALEFTLMISVTKAHFRYCREHWIDLVIILVPLAAGFRLLRLSKLGKLARLGKVAKAGRIYRLRGLALRSYRAIILLEVFQRIFPVRPQRRLERLRQQLEEVELEAGTIRQQIAKVEQQINDFDDSEDARPKMAVHPKSGTPSSRQRPGVKVN